MVTVEMRKVRNNLSAKCGERKVNKRTVPVKTAV